jgi:hypothetical protein
MALSTDLTKYLKNNNLSGKFKFAPQGVIFISDNKAFVGMDHGKLPLLSEDLIDRLLPIVKLGMYYEGPAGGPDQKIIEPLFGKYDDGFDYMAEQTIKNHPPEFLYALFSNNPPESISSYITDTTGRKTIFEMMVKAGNDISSLKKARPPNAETIRKFLTSISTRKIDFLGMAVHNIATEDNVIRFIKLGASQMWPTNWESYPNPAGKVAKKANDFRDNWCATKSPNGLYTIGSGHLLTIAKMTRKKIIDGSDIQ